MYLFPNFSFFLSWNCHVRELYLDGRVMYDYDFLYVRKMQVVKTKSYVKLYLDIPLQSESKVLLALVWYWELKPGAVLNSLLLITNELTKQVVYVFFYHSYP